MEARRSGGGGGGGGAAADIIVEVIKALPHIVEFLKPLGSLFQGVSQVVGKGRAEQPPNHAPQHAPRPSWLPLGINWAIAGQSGVGKSSLVNTIRGLRPSDSGAAAVGVSECTTEPRVYHLPNSEGKAKLWDLPGRGTQLVPDKNYLERYGIRHFHGVIIVAGKRVLEFDLELIKMLEEARVPWYYVRTHLDVDVESAESDHGQSPEQTLATIRTGIKTQMDRAGVSASLTRVYIVSTRLNRTQHGDWAKFSQDLAHDLERSTRPAH